MRDPDANLASANQSPPYVDVDLFASDRPLQDAVAANGAGAERQSLAEFGCHFGSAAMFERGRLANVHPPRLESSAAAGVRRDVVTFHDAYHQLMADSMAAGLHASTWRAEGTPAPPPAQVARGARFYMAAQVETGHLCPITMTRAAVAALAAAPPLLAPMIRKIIARRYDPEFRPWADKTAITLGMGMTEKQGGTDVRANTTKAVPSGDGYAITGHKWFMSAPMCDAFLVLAQAPGGLTCFLLPRFRPDGSVNALHLTRLKDKLGNRSNASCEVEFVDAYALRIGDEGRGVPTILQMVQLTRLDCALASAGLMRMALAQALHHARHRRVFGMPLSEQPMMRCVLADMALDVEAAVALVLRLCRAFDRAAADAGEAARARLLTPAVKYWVCKSAPAFVYEAMECLGGNGYVEDSLLPRLYREAPVNAIWEGSGNVMALDVLRVSAREADAAQAVLAELEREAAALPHVADAAEFIRRTLTRPDGEAHARAAIGRLALLAATAALQASELSAVAAIFARARLGGPAPAMFGATDLSAADAAVLLQRAGPG
jgi:putative acyl-CoA dehydrogenase